jgi:hypothetical protein
MSFNQYITKLQGLPDRIKKILLWGITIGLGIILLAWWVFNVKSTLQQTQNADLREELQIQSLQENIQHISEEIYNNGEYQ